jgi:hypothetical protein
MSHKIFLFCCLLYLSGCVFHGFFAPAGASQPCAPLRLVFPDASQPVPVVPRYGTCPPQVMGDDAMAYSNEPDAVPSDWLAQPVPPKWQVAQEEAAAHIGQWRQVFGQIRGMHRSKAMLYLNFGEDWREDFTIAVPKKAWKPFEKVFSGDLTGRNVKIRGYIESYYGPRIVLLNPQMLELTEE